MTRDEFKRAIESENARYIQEKYFLEDGPDQNLLITSERKHLKLVREIHQSYLSTSELDLETAPRPKK
jgi:hypothetical protein